MGILENVNAVLGARGNIQGKSHVGDKIPKISFLVLYPLNKGGSTGGIGSAKSLQNFSVYLMEAFFFEKYLQRGFLFPDSGATSQRLLQN